MDSEGDDVVGGDVAELGPHGGHLANELRPDPVDAHADEIVGAQMLQAPVALAVAGHG